LHLKRLSAPNFWRIQKKVKKWTVTPSPGPHKKFECIPLLILVRDILKLADTAKEAKAIIKSGEVLVDGKPRKDAKYPAGLMDIVSIPKLKKNYRLVPFRGGITLIEISKKESSVKLCRINNKSHIKGGLLQLNLHDGRNILVKKDKYKTGDSLLIELPSQKILEHVKMHPGNVAVITGGQNTGKIVEIKEVITTRSREPNKIVCKSGKEEFTAIKDYVFVIGYKNPVIKIEVK